MATSKPDALPRTLLCGLPVAAADFETIYVEIVRRAREGEGGWIVTANLEMVSRGVRDPSYMALLREADLITADGMPLVWASRRKKGSAPIPGRTTGSDMTARLIVENLDLGVAIVGGANPRIALEKIGVDPARAYVFDGKVDLTEEFVERLAQEVGERRLVFLGLGVPKQDKLALDLRRRLPQAIVIGVGGTFDFLAGLTDRAPVWMQTRGLEWLYRLGTEPRRLARRYLVDSWAGAVALVRDARSA